MAQSSYNLPVVGIARSCYRSKFGIPRQSGLIEEAKGCIELQPPYNQPNAVRGLEGFSHIWVLFIFSENLRDGWKATVRPPRLGGDKRIGVFASRSPFRPAPIGLSAMKLERIELGGHGRVRLHVQGLDLVDGTPVVDIKPYIPYTDAIPEAIGGFAPAAPDGAALAVSVAAECQEAFGRLPETTRALALKVIGADPRPAYQREPNREYQCYLDNLEIIWRTGDDPMQAAIIRISYVTHTHTP